MNTSTTTTNKYSIDCDFETFHFQKASKNEPSALRQTNLYLLLAPRQTDSLECNVMATPWHFQGESKTVVRQHYRNAKPMPTIQTSISWGEEKTPKNLF